MFPSSKWLRLVALLLMILIVAACGAGDTPAAIEPIATDSPAETTDGAVNPTAPAQADPVADPEAGTSELTTPTGPDLTGGELVVYSGRSEELVGPLIAQFQEETGIAVSVKYGDTAELAATILEEGVASPADIYFAQDAGALGALTNASVFAELPADVLGLVDARFRAPEGQWIGVSGRARVVAYNTEELTPEQLPASILDYTDPVWAGRIGWAPTNGSFQSFVTALRTTQGEDAARAWLEGIQANAPKVYNNNTAVLEAVAAGEISVGFINHYYLFRKLDEQGETFAARNYYFENGDIGGLINVAGVGILGTAPHKDTADAFVRYLLAAEAQQYFSTETYEYPLSADIPANETLPALNSTATPQIDLNSLYDLQGTLELLQELGIL